MNYNYTVGTRLSHTAYPDIILEVVSIDDRVMCVKKVDPDDYVGFMPDLDDGITYPFFSYNNGTPYWIVRPGPLKGLKQILKHEL